MLKGKGDYMRKYLHTWIYRKWLANRLVWLSNRITRTDLHMSKDRYRELDLLEQDDSGKFHQYAWSLEGIEAYISQCKNDKKPMPTIEELIDMSAWHSIDEPGIIDDVRRSLAVHGIGLEEQDDTK